MRWTYLVPRLLVVGLVWAFFTWVFDPLVRRGVVATAEAVNGARVDVSGLETEFFPPRIDMTGVAVADESNPDANRFQFDTLRVRLDGSALLERRWVVKEAAVEGLRFGTPRATSGRLDETNSDSADWFDSPQLDALRGRIGTVGRAWLEQLENYAQAKLDPRQLETVRTADALEMQWRARFEAYRVRLEDVELRVRAVRDGVKADGNTLQKIEAYRRAAVEVDQLLAEAQQIRGELSALYRQAGLDVVQIEQAKQRDLESLKEIGSILKFDKDAIAEALLGEEVLGHVEDAAGWVRWAREQFANRPELPEPERSRGIDIAFTLPDPRPSFVLQRLTLTGTATRDGVEMPYRGELRDVTSDAPLHGRPTTFALDVGGPMPVQLALATDTTGKLPRYDVTAHCTLPQPKQFTLGRDDEFNVAIAGGATRWDAKWSLVGDRLAGTMTVVQQDVRVTTPDTPAETSPPVQTVGFRFDPAAQFDPKQLGRRAIESALGGVTEIRAEAVLSGTLDEPQWTLHSDLGRRVADGLERFLADELVRQSDALRGQVETLARQETAELQAMLGDGFRKAAEDLNLTESQAKQLVEKYTKSAGIADQPLDIRGLFRR
jgi:uncharacterized protein (TIGR03545 family)